MEELIHEHSAIMDRYDPDKKVALLVDEWGTWYNVEEGTNPGFLYQQNTMRDAMVAAINLNIFNKHADRVKMANIAQVVNVLQAVILTEGAKMLLTPTYHVFEMFGAHQGNNLLDSFLASGTTGTEDVTVPDVMESASMDENGNVVMTLCNVDVQEEKNIDLELVGLVTKNVTGEYISGKMGDHNTFEAPETITKKEFKDLKVTANGLSLTLPPCSALKLVVTRA